MFGNLKFPTPEELGVIFWFVVICLFLLGAACVYLSLGRPPDKHELAVQIRWIGFWLMVGAAAMAALNWVRKRF